MWNQRSRARDNTTRLQKGSALIEYTVIAMFVVVVLVADGNAVAQLMHAIHELYQAFSHALSMTFPVRA